MKNVNKLGQYFTTNLELKEKLYHFILNDPFTVLEPSFGRGDLVKFITDKKPSVNFDVYEIDNKIKLLDNLNTKKISIVYGDFITQKIDKKYKTIIGNPPYIRTKNGNLYIDFIEKCYNLLEENGELIFIVPSDFFKLTSSSKLLNVMLKKGSFTHIFHPNNEKLFDNASIDILIFRYCKDILIEKIFYNDEELYVINNNGFLTFDKNKSKSKIVFKDYFEIYVGVVSGKEEVYKNKELGNIEILNGKNKIEKYILIDTFPCKDENINKYLIKNKQKLLQRKIRKFDENNWYEWGALRNIDNISKNYNKNCIYLHNLTRKDEVSFLDKVMYFGGNLLILIPKKQIDLNLVVKYLNSDIFKKNFIFSGRFKIGHRQISNFYIPDKCL